MGEKLKVEVVDVATLKQDPNNARLHPERNLEAIASSLRRFGQQKPIVVDQDGVVVAGNGMLRAAIELGWTKINVVRTSLTGDEAAAFAVIDNRTGELAEWDPAMLAELAAPMSDSEREALGFSAEEFARVLAALTPPALPDAPFKPVDSNIKTDYRCPSCGYEWSGKAVGGNAAD